MVQIVTAGQFNPAALGADDLYIQIINPPSYIRGVPTDVIGIVGTASWGPVNTAVQMGSALDGASLYIAGATAGVFDADGRTIDRLDGAGIDAMIADKSATAGMVAKLDACREALRGGAARVRIIDGRAVTTADDLRRAPGTEIVMEDLRVREATR